MSTPVSKIRSERNPCQLFSQYFDMAVRVGFFSLLACCRNYGSYLRTVALAPKANLATFFLVFFFVSVPVRCRAFLWAFSPSASLSDSSYQLEAEFCLLFCGPQGNRKPRMINSGLRNAVYLYLITESSKWSACAVWYPHTGTHPPTFTQLGGVRNTRVKAILKHICPPTLMFLKMLWSRSSAFEVCLCHQKCAKLYAAKFAFLATARKQGPIAVRWSFNYHKCVAILPPSFVTKQQILTKVHSEA